jgi:hypothetical protein
MSLLMNTTLKPFKDQRTILLTTYRRDGTPVSTPVSIAFDGDRAFFRTWETAWKAKRLRHNPNVEIAPSTFRGKATGPAMRIRARLLVGPEEAQAKRALARGQPLLHGFIIPLAHRIMRYKTIHFELVSEPGGLT